MNARSSPRAVATLTALAALPLLSSGCYTLFHHPRDPGAITREVRYAHDPYTDPVWGWYHDHYGPFRSYYWHPWWIHDAYQHGGTYYPGGDGFSPAPPGSGFGRGGRDGDRSGWSHPSSVSSGDTRTETTAPPGGSSQSGTDGESAQEAQPDEEKPHVGGRGRRR